MKIPKHKEACSWSLKQLGHVQIIHIYWHLSDIYEINETFGLKG